MGSVNPLYQPGAYEARLSERHRVIGILSSMIAEENSKIADFQMFSPAYMYADERRKALREALEKITKD